MIVPKYVVIQNIDNCNIRCSYCPQFGVKSDVTHTGIRMNDNLFYKILQEMKDVGYSGNVWIGSYCEPLTDPDIIERTNRVYDYNMWTSLFTNGILLPSMIDKGLRVNNAFVSLLGDLSGDFSYRSITKQSYDKTIDNIIYAHESGIHIDVIATLTYQDDITARYLIKRLRDYPDIGIQLGKLNGFDVPQFNNDMYNHVLQLLRSERPMSGISLSVSSIVGEECPTSGYICSPPIEVLSIRVNGDVEFCCLHNFIVGNMVETSCMDVFNAPHVNKFRDDLKMDGGVYKSCQQCIRKFRGY